MIEQQTSQSEKFDEDVTDYIILAMLENILPWNLFLSINSLLLYYLILP